MRYFGKLKILLVYGNKTRIQHNNFLLSSLKTNCNARVALCVHTSPRICTENTNDSSVLVYEGPLKKRIKRVKLLSLTSSMFGLALLPIVIKDVSQVSLALGVGGGLISSVFLATPLMLHWITKRYITELKYDTHKKLFTAKTFNLFSQETVTEFTASDVTVPDLPGMLSSFVVKDKSLFVDSRLVLDLDAYSHMMGYDKPFDFKFPNSESKDDGKSN